MDSADSKKSLHELLRIQNTEIDTHKDYKGPSVLK